MPADLTVENATPRERLLRLVPVLLLVHNTEEALTMAPVLPRVNARLAAVLPDAVPYPSFRAFLVALLFVTALPFVIAGVGDLRRPASRAGYLLLLVQATLLLNVVSHVGVALWLGGYGPGLATAVLVNLPFSLLLLRRGWSEGWYGRRAMAFLLPGALLVHGPGVIGLLWLVHLLDRCARTFPVCPLR